MYVAGVGQTSPPGQDGQINTLPLAFAAAPVEVVLPGGDFNHINTLPVTFAGAAPNLAAGIFQINFVAPQQSVTNLNLVAGTANAFFGVYVNVTP